MGKTLSRPIQRSMVHRQAAKPAPGAIPAPPSSVLAAFAPEDAADVQRVFAGCYDAPALSFGTPPSILDIGAHAGAATKFFLRRWPGCSVHAYEPHPELFEMCLRNFSTAGINHGSVVRVAISGDPSKTSIGLHERGTSLLGSSTVMDDRVVSTIVVPVMHPCDLPPADVVCIDVEGVEGEIVEGYRYWGTTRAVIVEVHSRAQSARIRSVLGLTHRMEFVRAVDHQHFPFRLELWSH